jgi:hypothetical protein
MMRILRGLAIALVVLARSAPDAGAAIVAPGYAVGELATPGIVTGGVAVSGGVVLVGVGPFGGASQSIVRIDGSGATEIADGFNGLSGFVYDAANDRLIVGDNALEVPGSETGDTLYGIPDPLGRSGPPLRAKDIELLPAGAIPGVADVVLDPNDPTGRKLFVTDASFPLGGPQDGKLLAVDDLLHTTSVLQRGLGFVAGLAAKPNELFLGDVDVHDFSGRVGTIPLPDGSGAITPLAAGLPGESDLVLASDGSLLAAVSSFSAGSFVVRIDPATGAVTTLASGFGFATAIAEEAGTIYVVDGDFLGVDHVTVLTPIPEPASVLGASTGLAVLALARRRAGRN